MKFRTYTFELWKNGGVVLAHFKGSPFFHRPKVHAAIERARVFAVDTESLPSAGSLKTLLIPVHFEGRTEVIETPDGRGMLEKLFDEVFKQPGYAEVDGRDRERRQRRPIEQKGRYSPHRPGRRASTNPVLSVWFNLPYDLGRLLSDSRQSLRAIASGADSYRLPVGRYELEVVRMHFGSSSSFEWFIRDVEKRLIVRMLGMDLTGYWKSSLANCAKAANVTAKDDIESKVENVYERSRESFSPEEWEMFRAYAAGDTITTLELYHRTVELLTDIDARVVRKTGLIPPSAPGASARIVFAKSFDQHPEIEQWERYPAWADQLGASSYFGGRAFCIRPGIYKRMATLDLKSAYPFQMALLPDPVTVRMVEVEPRVYEKPQTLSVRPVPGHPTPGQKQFVADWRGKYGVLYVSGESFDDVMPAFRVHDEERGGRLKYVSGKFKDVPVTIPELVIGVVRGAIRVDAITRTADRPTGGVEMVGSPEKSFLRAGMKEFFDIKENKTNDQALRDMAKLLMNSAYGKLIEIKKGEFTVMLGFPMNPFTNRQSVVSSLSRLYASSGVVVEDLYWGEDDAGRYAARGYYERSFLPGSGPEAAVQSYVEALDVGGAPRKTGPAVRVKDYVRGCKRYECGHFFMPIYASQVTGATSAMVGLMAHCTGALQGDTDSVHVVLPENVERIYQLPGVDRYFEMMSEAGYPSPRMVKGEDGKAVCVGGVPGLGKLGIWEEECPVPSDESILVRPKLYSHKFGDVLKQAKHGFAKFNSPEADDAMKESGSREERTKKANQARKVGLHEAMRRLLKSGMFSYKTRRSPRRLREAIVHELEVGEFTSREMTMVLSTDPNTWRDGRGVVRWKTPGWKGKDWSLVQDDLKVSRNKRRGRDP